MRNLLLCSPFVCPRSPGQPRNVVLGPDHSLLANIRKE